MRELLRSVVHDGKTVETAPVVCTDPDCGYVYDWWLDPETESWDDIPEYTECGRKEREIPGTSSPVAPDKPRLVDDPCEAPAKVFKDDEKALLGNDKHPAEVANEVFREAGEEGDG